MEQQSKIIDAAASINLADYIDHTMLKSDTQLHDIEQLCNEAIQYKFCAVCVNSCYVRIAAHLLEGAGVAVASTVGFPFGAMMSMAKAFEAEHAIRKGASEIDMVINIGFLKSGMHKEVVEDLKAVKKAIGHHVLKVIFENCLLSQEEKLLACKLSIEAGVDYIKTSTGFTTGSAAAGGATKEDLQLMLNAVANTGIKVKAAGGVKDYATAIEYISMGVSRIGTSSGIALISGKPADSKKY